MRLPAPSIKLARHFSRRWVTAPTTTVCPFGWMSSKATPCALKRCKVFLMAFCSPLSVLSTRMRLEEQGAASPGNIGRDFHKGSASPPRSAGRTRSNTAKASSASSPPVRGPRRHQGVGELSQGLRPRREGSASWPSSGEGSAVASRLQSRTVAPSPPGTSRQPGHSHALALSEPGHACVMAEPRCDSTVGPMSQSGAGAASRRARTACWCASGGARTAAHELAKFRVLLAQAVESGPGLIWRTPEVRARLCQGAKPGNQRGFCRSIHA